MLLELLEIEPNLYLKRKLYFKAIDLSSCFLVCGRDIHSEKITGSSNNSENEPELGRIFNLKSHRK